MSEQPWAYEAWTLLDDIEEKRWKAIPLEIPTAPTKTGDLVDAGAATISDELLSAHVRARARAGGGHAVAPTDEFYTLTEEDANGEYDEKTGKYQRQMDVITNEFLSANNKGGPTFRVETNPGSGNKKYNYYDAEALYRWVQICRQEKNPITNPATNLELSQEDIDALDQAYGAQNGGGEGEGERERVCGPGGVCAVRPQSRQASKGKDALVPVAKVLGPSKTSPATMYEVLILETHTVVEVATCCCVPLLVGYEVECVDGRWYRITALYEDACTLVLRGHPNEPPKRTPFEDLVSVLLSF